MIILKGKVIDNRLLVGYLLEDSISMQKCIIKRESLAEFCSQNSIYGCRYVQDNHGGYLVTDILMPFGTIPSFDCSGKRIDKKDSSSIEAVYSRVSLKNAITGLMVTHKIVKLDDKLQHNTVIGYAIKNADMHDILLENKALKPNETVIVTKAEIATYMLSKETRALGNAKLINGSANIRLEADEAWKFYLNITDRVELIQASEEDKNTKRVLREYEEFKRREIKAAMTTFLCQ